MSVEYNSNSRSVKRNINDKLEDLISETNDKIVDEAKSNAPVVSGRLRDSIRKEGDGLESDVVVGAPYAVYVEFGTRYQEAQRFLRDAILKGKQHFIREARKL